jgi:hypothetical protein
VQLEIRAASGGVVHYASQYGNGADAGGQDGGLAELDCVAAARARSSAQELQLLVVQPLTWVARHGQVLGAGYHVYVVRVDRLEQLNAEVLCTEHLHVAVQVSAVVVCCANMVGEAACECGFGVAYVHLAVLVVQYDVDARPREEREEKRTTSRRNRSVSCVFIYLQLPSHHFHHRCIPLRIRNPVFQNMLPVG